MLNTSKGVSVMKKIDLDKLDLLTLSILVSLYENKSATHVSRILDVPASKISRCLHSARLLFGDELFIRRKYGLVPNDYAGRIYPIAKEIVDCAKNFNRLNSTSLPHSRHFELVMPGMIAHAYPRALMNSIKEHHKAFLTTLIVLSCVVVKALRKFIALIKSYTLKCLPKWGHSTC